MALIKIRLLLALTCGLHCAAFRQKQNTNANSERNSATSIVANSTNNPGGTLHEGQRVKVWWPADERSYSATVAKVSASEFRLIYDDGERQTYSNDEATLNRVTIERIPIEELREGQRVKVWWRRAGRYYEATVAHVSSSEVRLIYDDGERKRYINVEDIANRMTLLESEICCMCQKKGPQKTVVFGAKKDYKDDKQHRSECKHECASKCKEENAVVYNFPFGSPVDEIAKGCFPEHVMVTLQKRNPRLEIKNDERPGDIC